MDRASGRELGKGGADKLTLDNRAGFVVDGGQLEFGGVKVVDSEHVFDCAVVLFAGCAEDETDPEAAGRKARGSQRGERGIDLGPL